MILLVAIFIGGLVALSRTAIGPVLARRIGGQANEKAALWTPVG
jgi:hypothetical protein